MFSVTLGDWSMSAVLTGLKPVIESGGDKTAFDFGILACKVGEIGFAGDHSASKMTE